MTDKYDSKQTSSSAGGGISQAGGGSLSLNASKPEMRSDYQSVDKQTGINAGKGGFDITVGKHTQLDGAIISSTADVNKNTLDTGTLGFGDIKNKAEYKVDSQSGGFSTGGASVGDQFVTNAAGSLLTNVNNKGKDSNTTHAAVSEGEITIRDKDNQKQDINLVSAQNTEQTNSKNSSKGSSVGVGVGVGAGGYGVNISASVNQGKGHEKGNGLTHTETTLDAGNKLTLNSGQDTTLKGAQVSGEQVTVNVGRDLTLQSEQDSDRYDAKQQEVSVGGGYTIGGTPNINISASKDKIHSNYDSVKEQTGIFAGKGGFDVNVKEHTQLDGAVIASTADKDKNRLDTGTLGWKDIDNKADFTAEHTGGSIGTGGPIGSQLVTNAAGGLLSNANNSGHAEGTTQSAVSDGTVIVRNEDKQKQDVNELNRDTEHANDGSINPIFDKEKEQNRLKQSQLIGEIGNQTMDIIRTEGDIAGLKAQKDPDTLAIAKKQLEAAGKTLTDDAIKQQAYNNAMAQYGTGSDFQKAAQAVTGLLQGLAGDNLAGALVNASSPYLATLIKQQVGEDNKAANAMAHAVLGAVVAELNNQSAVAGGLGAGGGELSAHVILNTLFPGKKVSDLTESEKQQVSALSQLASGLAGGLTTGDVAGAITGSQAAKNAVENNAISGSFVGRTDEQIKETAKVLVDGVDLEKLYGDDKEKIDAYRKGSVEGRKEGLKDGVVEVLEGTANSIAHPIDTVTDLATAIWNYDETYDAIKISATQWNELYEDALINNPELAGKMSGAVQGKLFSNATTSVVVSGAMAKTLHKVAQIQSFGNSFTIKSLPDVNGKNHVTAVRGDAHIPLDKVEIWLRGGAKGDLDSLTARLNVLKAERMENQSAFAKSGKNLELNELESNIKRINRSREMGANLEKVGIDNTTNLNNSIIIDELLKSAKTVDSTNAKSSIILKGTKGSIRINATWKVLPDGTKRLATVTTGTF